MVKGLVNPAHTVDRDFLDEQICTDDGLCLILDDDFNVDALFSHVPFPLIENELSASDSATKEAPKANSHAEKSRGVPVFGRIKGCLKIFSLPPRLQHSVVAP